MKKLIVLLLITMNPIVALAKTTNTMFEKQAIYTTNAPAPIGIYSQAIKIGNMIYISGQIAMDSKTGELVKGGFNNELEQVMTNLSEIIKASGGTFGDVIKITIYVTDLGNFAAINQAMKNYFPKPYPARVVVEVKGLPKHAAIEIEAVMEKSDKS